MPASLPGLMLMLAVSLQTVHLPFGVPCSFPWLPGTTVWVRGSVVHVFCLSPALGEVSFTHTHACAHMQ